MNPQAWLRNRQGRRTLTGQWEADAKTWTPGTWNPPHVNELVNARVPSAAWMAYQNLTGSVALSTHRVVVLHRSGLTPVLCQRWLDQRNTPSTFVSVTLLAAQIEAMVDAGIPAQLAGLYALAGYDAKEAALSHCKHGGSAAVTLQVEVALAL